MSKAISYLAESEAGKSITILDTEDPGTPCRSCGSTGVVYTCHCWREPERPLFALCKGCAERRAGGPDAIAVRSDRLGLLAGWQRGERARLTEKQLEQRRGASSARGAASEKPGSVRPNREGEASGVP
jgi:hypothetical protein